MAEIISSEYPDLPDAVDLLHALNTNPTFMTGQPSPTFSAFLQRIETATPTPSDDEDDTRESWGHAQFTAGSMTCTSVLDTWASVGSPGFAYRLIAAALTTCRVARWICMTHPDAAPMPAFYLSDNYLNEVCRLLWAAWKSAGGVCLIQSRIKLTC